MIEPLAPLFRGALEEIGDALIVDDGREALEPLDTFLQGDRLAAALARFGGSYEQPEPRAVASQWSKLYFSRLLVPATAAAIAADWRLPLDPRRLRVCWTLKAALPPSRCRMPGRPHRLAMRKNASGSLSPSICRRSSTASPGRAD